jgi:hypothetical protein
MVGGPVQLAPLQRGDGVVHERADLDLHRGDGAGVDEQRPHGSQLGGGDVVGADAPEEAALARTGALGGQRQQQRGLRVAQVVTHRFAGARGIAERSQQGRRVPAHEERRRRQGEPVPELGPAGFDLVTHEPVAGGRTEDALVEAAPEDGAALG